MDITMEIEDISFSPPDSLPGSPPDNVTPPLVPLAEYLCIRLYELGIRCVFGVPGDYNLELLDRVETTGLKWCGNAAELTAGYAADGYARIRGLSALVTVFGVGELSALNAVAGSYAERVPVVHIVGTPASKKPPEGHVIHHSLGEGDVRTAANVYVNFTCAQVVLRDVISAPTMVDDVLRTCIAESRPVYIELPMDMARESVSAMELNYPLLDPEASMKDQWHRQSDKEELVALMIRDRLYSSKQAVVIVDGFATRYKIAKEVNQLLESTGLPAATTPCGQGIIHETYRGFYGVYAGPGGCPRFKTWIEDCDLVLHIAPLKSDANTYFFTTTAPKETTIELDKNCITVFGTRYPNLRLKSVLRYLVNVLDPWRLQHLTPDNYLKDPRRSPSPSTAPADLDPAAPITHDRFWPRMSRLLRQGDIILADAGTTWSGTEALALPPNVTVIKSALWMSTGFALGASIGAAQAHHEREQEGQQRQQMADKEEEKQNDRTPPPLPAAAAEEEEPSRTILFTGDGSFQMTSQALSDAIRNRLQLTIFVLNNAGYTIERAIHRPHASYNSVQPWRYTEAVGFMGAPVNDPSYPVWTVRVSAWAELEAVLGDEKLRRGLCLVEVVVGALDVPGAMGKFLDLYAGGKL